MCEGERCVWVSHNLSAESMKAAVQIIESRATDTLRDIEGNPFVAIFLLNIEFDMYWVVDSIHATSEGSWQKIIFRWFK